jgi:hypothetical protein
MSINSLLERYAGIAAPDPKAYAARLGETEELFDYLAASLITSGDVLVNRGDSQLFRPIDLGHYALQSSRVHVVAQPARRIMFRIHTPDRIKRSIQLKIPDEDVWFTGSDERLTADNSQQLGYVSINSAFQAATPRSMSRLEEFRSILDEVMTSL